MYIPIILLTSAVLASARLPTSPCPEIYKYERNASSFDGIITAPDPPALGSVLVLKVGLSFKGKLDPKEKGILYLGEKKWIAQHRIKQGIALKYRVVFPVASKIPNVIKIEFNGKVICTGDSVRSANPTNYSLTHIFKSDKITTAAKPVVVSKFFNESDTSPLIDRVTDNWDNVCGFKQPKISVRIFGGEITSIGDWPWLVAIFRSGKYICGGTLISKKMILTAAHCVASDLDFGFFSWEPEQLTIRLGAYNISDSNEETMIMRKIIKNNVHPKFNMVKKFQNDIALLEMNETVNYNSYISPACLWSSLPDQIFIQDTNGIVAGWGRNDLISDYSEIPRSIKIPIVSLETCRSSSTDLHHITSENTICAGSRDGTGPCKGDSGSGLYLELRKRWALRGVVSVSLGGKRICDLNNYVIFTDVAKYINWLKVLEPSLNLL